MKTSTPRRSWVRCVRCAQLATPHPARYRGDGGILAPAEPGTYDSMPCEACGNPHGLASRCRACCPTGHGTHPESESNPPPLHLCTIMRGIPGSGKTTWAIWNTGGATFVSANDWFTREGTYRFDPSQLSEAHRACFARFLEVLAGRLFNVTVDNTDLTAAEVAPYYLAAEASGYEARIVEVYCNVPLAIRRNVHGVPAHAIERMATTMDREHMMPWWRVERVRGDDR